MEQLRADYRKIVSSRFFVFRVAWLSFWALLGSSKAKMLSATWTTGMLPEPALGDRERPDITPAEVITLWSSRSGLKARGDDVVTVVVPVFNHLDATLRCLYSIAQTWFDSLAVQFIVVDDASEDESPSVLQRIPGIEYIRNDENLGFVRSCNAAAKHARGRYVCFLNNDTIVQNGWLDHLVTVAERDSSVGAVGAKLIYPDGRLQEAGGIIWSDGSGWNVGRGSDPRDSRYNFVREVDYCSGAALLVRTALFEQLGGFDETFAPAYYEDADLAFAIRRAGFRVVFQPKAEVVHVEGVTSGTDTKSGAKHFQEINRPKFARKWERELAAHFEGDQRYVDAAARRLIHKPRGLIVDSYVPLYDKEAGSARLMEIVRGLRARGYGIVFMPDNYAALQPYTNELEQLGVEVLYHSERGRSREEALVDALALVDFVWICRPELFKTYAPIVRRESSAKLIYDTIDLHFVRKKREAAITGAADDVWKAFESLELTAAGEADSTVVVSEEERQILSDREVHNVFVVPTVHERRIDTPPSFEGTSGLLFIGNYNHTPNVDAVEWLCREIMPFVWKARPEITVTLLGSNPTSAVSALASSRVAVTGYLADVGSHFRSARLFVAPLRFGAGLKGKIGQSMSFGLPIVATEVAAEGFEFVPGVDYWKAGTAAGFAETILHAYDDREKWYEMSKTLRDRVQRYSSEAVCDSVERVLRFLDGGA